MSNSLREEVKGWILPGEEPTIKVRLRHGAQRLLSYCSVSTKSSDPPEHDMNDQLFIPSTRDETRDKIPKVFKVFDLMTRNHAFLVHCGSRMPALCELAAGSGGRHQKHAAILLGHLVPPVQYT
jgi:hypothetical protein